MERHPLVTQLKLARRQLMRVLEGLSEEDAVKRIMPMNSISWVVGHLANQEASYWIAIAQGDKSYRWLNDIAGYMKPASTPPLKNMVSAWMEITQRADEFLDSLTADKLVTFMTWKGEPVEENIGTMLSRMIAHYWYHIGQAHAARELLGHQDLPELVGDMTGYEWQNPPEGLAADVG